MAVHATECPECGRTVAYDNNHDPGCFYEGYDVDSLEKIKESWDKEAEYERWKGI